MYCFINVQHLPFVELKAEPLHAAGLSSEDIAGLCVFAVEHAPALLRSLRCLRLGPPRAAGGEAARFADGAWQAVSQFIAKCERLEVAELWGATEAQAGAWAAELEQLGDPGGDPVASLTRECLADGGLHVRLSTLPECAAAPCFIVQKHVLNQRVRMSAAVVTACHLGVLQAWLLHRGACCEAEQWPADHILPPEAQTAMVTPAVPSPMTSACSSSRPYRCGHHRRALSGASSPFAGSPAC